MASGSYATSFLRIYINTNQLLDKLDDSAVPDFEKRIFIHEYTHFLQNLMTGFGHRHVWNTFDRLLQLMAEQRTNGQEKLMVPLISPERTKQDLYLRARKTMEGSYEVEEGMNDATTEIVDHVEFADPTFEILQPGTGAVFLKLLLKDDTGCEMQYIFGRSAVAEAMAKLMDNKFYAADPSPNFPYHVCRLLGKHLGTEMLENKELLFALCDVSLLWQYPGKAFYRILQELIAKNNVPASGEAMFDYGLKYMELQGWPVWEEFEKSRNGAVGTLQSFFAHPTFAETRNWFIYLLNHGHGLRVARPHFLLEIYKETHAFEGNWKEAVARFGNPEIYTNKEKIRHFNAPLDLKDLEGKIYPMILLGGREVQRTLLKGEKDCTLLNCCKHSTNGLITDERCENTPWLRAQDNPTCPYGAVWASHGLKNKIVEIVVKPV